MAGDAVQLQPARREALVSPRARRRRRVVLVLGGVLAAFLGWEGLTSVVNYTDDAYVWSDLVAVAPEVTGPVIAVHVHDNQAVRKGDKLFSIDPTPFRLALDAQRAALREAQAQKTADQDTIVSAADRLAAANAALVLAQQTEQRAAQLEAESFASHAQLDTATAGLRRAEADVQAAKAAVARAQRVLARDDAGIAQAAADAGTAQWRLDRTEVVAPVDGSITNLTLRPGDMARANVPLIGVVDAHAWRIVANYKQYYIRSFRVGATGWVWLDSRPWHIYRARIQGIARGISRNPTPSALLPYVSPTTDWIRLQRRFPVTLLLDGATAEMPLYMGADARVVIFP